MRNKNKFGQEEMVGFALIIIIVAVILLVFLSFSLRNPQKEIVESYEVENYIQSFLQYTTECRVDSELLSVQDLIFACVNERNCENEGYSCNVLNSVLSEINVENWKTGEDRPVRGYSLNITSEGENIVNLNEGERTGNSKGSEQILPRDVFVVFNAYY
ncbi:MAG: hypothetical protein ABIH49_02810 [archaeon]